MADATAGDGETVGAVAELYLGNILYAIELAALSLEAPGQTPLSNTAVPG